MKVPTILQIGDILVSSEVLTEYFCCDYATCRGACCIIGDSGAPLLENETELLERHYPQYEGWMSSQAAAPGPSPSPAASTPSGHPCSATA